MSDFDRNTARWGQAIPQAGRAQIDQGLRSYMLGVYNNMVIGLAITGLFAYGANVLAVTQRSGAGGRALRSYLSHGLRPGALFQPAEMAGGVRAAGVRLLLLVPDQPHVRATARALFFVFSAAMGLSLSTLVLVYTGNSIARAFFITAASFGALSLYGYTTPRSLSAMGSFMMMGLFGLIIASVVNIFLHSTGLQFALSILAVIIFAGLTAWDTQAIKEMYYVSDDYETATKKSVNGALRLYLDFINIFVAMLQLTGSRNN